MDLAYFEAVVSGTEGVAIGPLEYCGNGQVLKDSHQQLMYAFILSLSIIHFLIISG